jgi:2-methylcitrate dehydratase PrpD
MQISKGKKMSFIDRCSSFIKNTNFNKLTSKITEKSKYAIFDTIAVTIAGLDEPVSKKLLDFLLIDRAVGPSTVLGTPHMLSPASAAMINGTMAHALDYDDVSPTTRSHPSAVLVPAVLAVGEALHSGGKDIITAYAIGVEVITRVGSLAAFALYEKGWHSTSVLGVLGAAAATSNLLGLNAAQISAALGIAASGASGLQRNFGTMTKPMHCGMAAQIGVMAGLLAKNNFTASDDVFSGRVGFISIFGGNSLDLVEADGITFGEPWEIVQPGLTVKRYACCYATHRAADAVLGIMMGNPDFNHKDIKTVTVTAPLGSFYPLVCNSPQTGLEGKFSMQYVVAAGIIDRKITLQSFTDSKVNRIEIQNLIKRIEKVENPKINFAGPDGKDQRFAEVCIKLNNGKSIVKRVEYPRGSPESPLTREEMIDKYFECTERYLTRQTRDSTINMLLHFEDIEDITILLSKFRTAP